MPSRAEQILRACLRAFQVASGLIVLAAAAHAGERIDGIRVDSIHVSGNQRVATETIRHHLAVRPGESWDGRRADAALKALFATGQFSDVRIDRDGDRIIVTVVESPVIAGVGFEGARAIEEKALKEIVRLKAGEPYARAKVDAAAAAVREAYRAKGHSDAAVEVRTAERPGNRTDVTFVVREGGPVRIERIAFAGNRAFSERDLRDVISTRQAGLFDFLRGAAAQDEARLDIDRELLVRHYKKHGYADVAVGRPKSERAPGADGGAAGDWLITFDIDEGERYAMGEVTLASLVKEVQAEPLRRHITMGRGAVFNAEEVEASIERITKALIDAGHTSTEVVAAPKRDPARRTIGLEYVVRPGPGLVIERIDIVGNAKTKNHVIRRELRFAEGDVYHPLLAERARRRLKGLGYLKSVDIRARKTADPRKIALTVEVVELDSRELGFGIGYSSTEGVTGDVSITERNLFGNGQYLRLKLAGSEARREAEIGFTEPYFLGHRLAAGFDLFYRDLDLSRTSSYQSTRYGGTLRLGFEVADSTRATVNYTLSRTNIHDVGPFASAAIKQSVPGYPNASSGSYDTSSIGYTIAYDTRDRTTNPMRGVYVSTSQDLAGLGGDVRYLRTVSEVRGYYPVTERITLATRVFGGTITGIGGGEVRLLDMFYRGGETVRGFATGGFGPRDIASANRDALGGASFLATTAELRFPLPFAPDDIGLRAAVFADAGSLWGTNRSTKATPGVVGTSAALRASAGAGLIWDSPLGPLRVDYAHVLAKQPFDKTQPLRFGLMPGF